MQPPKTQSWNCYFFPSQRHWHVIADRQTIVKLNLKCYILYEINKMYVTSTNILMFKISIAIVSIIISIIIITITVIISSIIIVFIKSAWRIFQIKQLSPAILVSHNFWRQKFAYFFVFTFSLFKSYIILWIKITWAI